MNNYMIYLRNGVQIPVTCDRFSITYSNLTGKPMGYGYQNAIYNEPSFLDVNEIVAVIKTGPVGKEKPNEEESES